MDRAISAGILVSPGPCSFFSFDPQRPLQGRTPVPMAALRRMSRRLPSPPKSSQVHQDMSERLCGRPLAVPRGTWGRRVCWEDGKSSGRKVRIQQTRSFSYCLKSQAVPFPSWQHSPSRGKRTLSKLGFSLTECAEAVWRSRLSRRGAGVPLGHRSLCAGSANKRVSGAESESSCLESRPAFVPAVAGPGKRA